MVDRQAETASSPESDSRQAGKKTRPGLLIFSSQPEARCRRVEVSGMLRVGRGEDVDVWLDDAGASRLHALFSMRDGRVDVTDAASTHASQLHALAASIAKSSYGQYLLRVLDEKVY